MLTMQEFYKNSAFPTNIFGLPLLHNNILSLAEWFERYGGCQPKMWTDQVGNNFIEIFKRLFLLESKNKSKSESQSESKIKS